jgi:hypothetical protein
MCWTSPSSDMLDGGTARDVIPGTSPPRRIRASDNAKTGRSGWLPGSALMSRPLPGGMLAPAKLLIRGLTTPVRPKLQHCHAAQQQVQQPDRPCQSVNVMFEH